MLEKLSKKQEEQLAVYKDKYLKVGLSTGSFKKTRAKEIINSLYKQILQKPEPKEIMFAKGPQHAYALVLLTEKGKKIPKNMEATIKAAKKLKVDYVFPYLSGSFFASPIAFYDYFQSECGIDYGDELKAKFEIWKNTTELGLVYPLETVCVVSEKPKQIHMLNEKLHKDLGAAIAYNDGAKVYALSGVRFPEKLKHLVLKKAKDITKKVILSIRNVDQRREVIYKIGVELACEKLGAKVVDKWGDYELLSINLGDTYRPFLKMKNPSIDRWHIEGVEPKCKTVAEALEYRNGTKDLPEIVT